MKPPKHSQNCLNGGLVGRQAFTIVELMVSMLILTIIATVLFVLTDATSKLMNRTTNRVVQFQGARLAFEAVTRRLSQATLNTYVDYDDPTAPKNYVRFSELRFISGKTTGLLSKTATQAAQFPGHGVFFQAPLGFVDDPVNDRLRNLLNTWGYYVEFGDDRTTRPSFLDTLSKPPPLNYRFRLMELMEPTEKMGIYYYTSGLSGGKPKCLSYTGKEWFQTSVNATTSRPVRPIADNVLALVLLPKLTPGEDPTGAKLCPKYEFDSSKTDINNSATVDPRYNWKNQLPPVVNVTMIAVEEESFKRFQTGSSAVDLIGSRFAQVGDLSQQSTSIYSQDLESLETDLRDKYRLNVRIFSTDVAIRGAKWSRDQAN